ncbi:hypothetical protein IQ07DRAFT_637627 [Pyrenochaeta sp. DS3sAY3a]|nr:hypothetical protein IQ07DRAFT_637627 [Pyrenochaeta sp. DS3sAY3a]
MRYPTKDTIHRSRPVVSISAKWPPSLSTFQNLGQRLNHVVLDMLEFRLFIFVDALFANNKDLTPHMGYMIVVGNKMSPRSGRFKSTATQPGIWFIRIDLAAFAGASEATYMLFCRGLPSPDVVENCLDDHRVPLGIPKRCLVPDCNGCSTDASGWVAHYRRAHQLNLTKKFTVRELQVKYQRYLLPDWEMNAYFGLLVTK